jgi:hypothetical protein
VITNNNPGLILKDIRVQMPSFSNNKEQQLKIKPELFLEWAVQVKAPSTGYPKSFPGKRLVSGCFNSL